MRAWFPLKSLALATFLTTAAYAGGAADVRWEALNDGGGGCNGTIYTAVASGDTLIVGGSFTVIGNVAAHNIALWDGKAWHALGKEISEVGEVKSIVLDHKGGFYAGGRFGSAGNVSASNIAHWDGKTWSSLSDSTRGEVLNLAVSPTGDLYASGYFSFIGGKAIKGVARWDGKGWSALGLGVNSLVTQLVLDQKGGIVVSGMFDSAGGKSIKGLARYFDGNWASLGGRISTTDTKLMLDRDGGVIATNLDTGLMAKWNGTKWDSITTKGLEYQDVWSQSTKKYDGITRDSAGTLWMAGRRATPSSNEWIRWSLTPTGWKRRENIDGNPQGMITTPRGHILLIGSGFLGGWSSSSEKHQGTGLLNYSDSSFFGAGLLRSEVYSSRNQIKVDARGHVFVMAPAFLGGKFESLMEWDGTTWNGLSSGLDLSTAQSLSDIAVGGDGSLFVVGWGKIYRRDPVKKQWDTIGTYPASSGQVLDADAAGNLYVGGNFNKLSGVNIRYSGFWDAKSKTWSAIDNPVPSDTNFETQRIKLLPDGRLALAGYSNALKSHKFGIWNPKSKLWTVAYGVTNARYTEDLQVSPTGTICRVLHYGINDYSLSCSKFDSNWTDGWGKSGVDGYAVPLRIAIDAQDNVYGFVFRTTPQKPAIGVLQPSRYNRKLGDWEPLGTGVSHEKTLIFNGSELKETLALDPTGKRLYALGNFSLAGDVVSPWIATADVADLSPNSITAPTSAGRQEMLRITRQGILLSPAWQGPVEVSILDLQGRRLWSSVTGPSAMIPYPALASGAYLVRARSATQSQQSSLIRP